MHSERTRGEDTQHQKKRFRNQCENLPRSVDKHIEQTQQISCEMNTKNNVTVKTLTIKHKGKNFKCHQGKTLVLSQDTLTKSVAGSSGESTEARLWDAHPECSQEETMGTTQKPTKAQCAGNLSFKNEGKPKIHLYKHKQIMCC